MGRFNAVTRSRGAFVAALTTACVFGAAGYAQSDVDQVKAAVEAYHAALSAGCVQNGTALGARR